MSKKHDDHDERDATPIWEVQTGKLHPMLPPLLPPLLPPMAPVPAPLISHAITDGSQQRDIAHDISGERTLTQPTRIETSEEFFSVPASQISGEVGAYILPGEVPLEVQASISYQLHQLAKRHRHDAQTCSMVAYEHECKAGDYRNLANQVWPQLHMLEERLVELRKQHDGLAAIRRPRAEETMRRNRLQRTIGQLAVEKTHLGAEWQAALSSARQHEELAGIASREADEHMQAVREIETHAVAQQRTDVAAYWADQVDKGWGKRR